MSKKKRYQAVYYSGDKVIDKGRVRDSTEEVATDIKAKEEEFSMFKYLPWDKAETEEFNPPRFATKAGVSGTPKLH